MLAPEQAAALYVAAWNAPDADTRFTHLLEVVADEVTVLDPHVRDPITTRAALAAHIAHFRADHDHAMEPTAPLDVHHGVIRLRWRFHREADGDTLQTGTTVAEIAPGVDGAGRLARILHFVD